MAGASRNRMPRVAARPVAAVTDIGVASPGVHGQAMIGTATALVKPIAQPFCGGNHPHPGGVKRVMTATAATT